LEDIRVLDTLTNALPNCICARVTRLRVFCANSRSSCPTKLRVRIVREKEGRWGQGRWIVAT